MKLAKRETILKNALTSFVVWVAERLLVLQLRWALWAEELQRNEKRSVSQSSVDDEFLDKYNQYLGGELAYRELHAVKPLTVSKEFITTLAAVGAGSQLIEALEKERCSWSDYPIDNYDKHEHCVEFATHTSCEGNVCIKHKCRCSRELS